MVSSGDTSGLEFHALIQAHTRPVVRTQSRRLLRYLCFFSPKSVRGSPVSWAAVWVALTLIGLAMTKSRGSYLGFVGASALLFIRNKADFKRALKPLAIVVIPLIVGALMIPEVMTRVIAIGAGEADPNILIRLEMWPKAIGYFLDSPVVGIGFGRFNDENLGILRHPQCAVSRD